METIKFKRAYFEDENCAQFIRFKCWGVKIDDAVFVSPTNVPNAMRFIDCQATGCEDAEINGRMVYENDIIENCDTKELQVVYCNKNESAWYCRYINSDRIVSLADSLGNLNKVVGNKFENTGEFV